MTLARLTIVLLSWLVVVSAPVAASAGDLRRHAIAKVGQPSIPPDYKHFPWVNPDAPKGGSLRLSSQGTFDSLNLYSYQGIAAPGLGALDASLMMPNLDEPATAYGYLAEWVSYPDDVSSATFKLRSNARFHDGRAVTVDDVIWSLEAQKAAAPAVAIFYRDVVKVEQTGDGEVTFRFAKAGGRDLPYAVGLLAVLPKHWWTAKGENGEPRDLSRTTLEAPVGSGPYRIKSVDRGRRITYERVEDWWAKDLPLNVGQYNFSELHYTMFRDDVPEFEALKAGDLDIKQENVSRKWATGYVFPAIREGRMKKLELPTKTVAQVQGFAFNLRRAKFQDPRTRRALALAYDFQTANKSLFYGLYKRLDSYFDNSELAATGLPSPKELALLEPLRGKVPPEVFTSAYTSPRADTPDDFRKNLREAARLLDEAGWRVADGTRRNDKGEALKIEFLNYDTSFDRIVLPFKQNLARIGVELTIRIVDAPQYEQRLKSYDFELITDAITPTYAPGTELRERWGTEAAGKEATSNRMGVRNPAVDALIEEVIYAKTREDLIAATRALDRVLLWNHYMVLQWYNPDVWLAYWDKLARPERYPMQDPSFVSTWWWDAAAAAKLGAANGRR